MQSMLNGFFIKLVGDGDDDNGGESGWPRIPIGGEFDKKLNEKLLDDDDEDKDRHDGDAGGVDIVSGRDPFILLWSSEYDIHCPSIDRFLVFNRLLEILVE